MNLTPRWVPFLEGANYECRHWSRIGPVTAGDSEICAYARKHGFVVITNDMDFPQILAHTGEGGPSVVLLRGEPLSPVVRGRVLLEALAQCADDLRVGALLTINWSDKVRANLLPLRR